MRDGGIENGAPRVDSVGADRSPPAAFDRRPIRVLHVITRMIVGGAQENTLLSCTLVDRERFPSDLLTGEETGSEGNLHDEVLRGGVPCSFEPTLVRDPHPIKDLLAVLRMARFMKRGNYDVVHTHTAKAGILGRMAARLAGIRHVVTTVHGWCFTPEQSWPVHAAWAGIERVCAPLCDTLIVVATQDREDGLANRIGRRDQYRLVRSGIELEAYRDIRMEPREARARLGLPQDAYVIGTVGRLSDQKAPLDLVRAFAILAAPRPDAHLVVVGDGPLRPDVERAVAAAGLSGRVHLLGIRRDVPEILRAMDVFALTSRWEGLPRVFPQAMCAALPIVATRVDGAADIIVPGENGWLVDVGDMDTFGAHLIELGWDAEARARMGKTGLAKVDEYSAERMVRQLEEIYLALVEGREPPGIDAFERARAGATAPAATTVAAR